MLPWLDGPGDRPLLQSGQRTWTTAELRTSVAALTRRLHKALAGRPVAEPPRVVILGGLHGHVCQAWLAVTQAGALATVLDDRQPLEWTKQFLGRVQPDLVLHDAEYETFATALDGVTTRLRYDVILDEASAALRRGDAVDSGPLPARTGPATTVLSSGSTGAPKEVLVAHELLDGFLSATEIWGEPQPGEVVALLQTFATITAPHLLSVAWRTGRAVTTYDVHRDGIDGLAQTLLQHRVTHLLTQTSLLRSLLRVADLSQSSLRVVMVGGEAMLSADLERASVALPVGHEFRVVYGMSECGLIASVPISSAKDSEASALQPHHDVRIMVTDDEGVSVADGDSGELWATGPRMAMGYLIDGALITDRFREVDGRRWFRTGDCGRLRSDGALEFLGRVDTRLKIRGYNVYPEAVEAALSSIDGVMDSVVVGAARPGGGTCLVAFIVPSTAPPISSGELRRALGDGLPEYFVPSVFVISDSLPSLANGKRDRALLRERAATYRYEVRSQDRPGTETERAVHQIASELLVLDGIGVHDDLLDLGMDSLMLAEFSVRLGDVLSHRPEVADIIGTPTIAGIVAQSSEATAGLVPLVSGAGPVAVVLVPGAGSTLAYLRPLARQLAPAGPVLGFPAGDHATISVEAGLLVEGVRSAGIEQVVLVGHSWGGLVAHAAARQLRKAGVVVERLVLLDSGVPARGRISRRLWIRRRSVSGNREAPRPTTVATSRAAASAIGDGRFFEAVSQAKHYRPRPDDVRTLLIRASATSPRTTRQQWSRLVGQLDVVDITATHRGIVVEPALSGVSAAIVAALR